MQVFLIKKSLINNIFEIFTKKVIVEEDIISIKKDWRKIKFKDKIKFAKEISNILIENNSNKVIVEKDLKQDKEFINLLYSNQIDVINGRMLFKELIEKIIDKIIKDNKLKKEEITISITANNRDIFIDNLVNKLSGNFKRVNIVTNNINKFIALEERIFNDKGIIITVTNNKRKSLLKSDIILNIDFPEEMINRYTIYDNSIIINIEESIKIKKKRFNGKIINGYKIKLKKDSQIYNDLNQEKYEEFDLKDLVECYIINNNSEIENILIC